MNSNQRPIDKVTVTNLDAALRVCGISLKRDVIDLIIDLVEEIEIKGDEMTLKDILCVKDQFNLNES